MKIRAHVLKIEDHGDKLELTLQGTTVGQAEWRPWLSATLQIPRYDNNRAYYVGRSFDIEVTPR